MFQELIDRVNGKIEAQEKSQGKKLVKIDLTGKIVADIGANDGTISKSLG